MSNNTKRRARHQKRLAETIANPIRQISASKRSEIEKKKNHARVAAKNGQPAAKPEAEFFTEPTNRIERKKAAAKEKVKNAVRSNPLNGKAAKATRNKANIADALSATARDQVFARQPKRVREVMSGLRMKIVGRAATRRAKEAANA